MQNKLYLCSRMKRYLIIILLLLIGVFTASAQEVIAHRGYHAKANGAHNSIGAFVAAIESGFTMSEFDIVRTAKGERIVAHGPKHGQMKISESSFEELRTEPLVNGEQIPSLTEFLEMTTKYPEARLIVEIKSDSAEEELVSCDVVLKELERLGLIERSTFISFSQQICDYFAQKGYPTLYLAGDMKPKTAKERGYEGINYHSAIYKLKPNWIRKAHNMGLKVGVWTVNSEKVAKWAIRKGLDYITSDDPEMVRELIANKEQTREKRKRDRR